MSKTTSLDLSISLRREGAKQKSEKHTYSEDTQESYCRFDCYELLESLQSYTKVWFDGENYRVSNQQGCEIITEEGFAEALGKAKLWCLQNGHCKE